MQIRAGFEMEYRCRGPTPMILALSIHYSRASDLVRPDHLVTSPAVPVSTFGPNTLERFKVWTDEVAPT